MRRALEPRIGRVRTVGTLLALAAALAVPATAQAAAVAVFDDRLEPRRVKVGVGERVNWINGGTRAHRVVSDRRGAWAPFTLQPRESRSVRFPRRGRFPYRVDGALRGVVVVVASGAGRRRGGGRGGDGRGKDDGESVHRYSVVVHGRTLWRTTYMPETGVDGQIGFREGEASWRLAFRDVRLAVRRDRFGTSLSTQGIVYGDSALKLRYVDEVRAGAITGDTRPFCAFSESYLGFPSYMTLQGGTPRGGGPGGISFESGIENAGDVVRDLVQHQSVLACPERLFGNEVLTMMVPPDMRARGFAFRGHPNPPETDFTRDWGGRIRFPMNRLVRGRSARVRSGVHRYHAANRVENGDCPPPEAGSCIVDAAEASFDVVFRRR